MKTISEEGLKLIKSFEGCRLTAYDDLQPKAVLTAFTPIIGTLTIGWGHTANVRIGQTITPKEADNFLLSDLTKYVAYVNNPAYVPVTDQLNQNQFDALVSFCYNCGQGGLKSLCINRTIEQIPVKMLEYNKSKGIILAGLVRRRLAEKQLFEKVVNNMDYDAKIQELEEVVKNIIVGLTKVSDKLAEIPAPDWFIKEFPYALDLLNQKTGTADFWRAFDVCLRIMQKQNETILTEKVDK